MYRRYFKRLIDVSFSAVAIVFISPVFLIVAALVKLTSRGPIIFQQERLAKGGDVFKMYKFRSMYLNSEVQGVYSDNKDPRLTPIGKWIRLFSLDELPQFFNVLKGDMSLIGPRPILTYMPFPIEEYTEDQLQVLSVRPGMTGWAQVHGRKEVQWADRFELNIWYVHHLSFYLDLKIFFITIYKVLGMHGNQSVGRTDIKIKADKS
ncbi:sugar transferase [Weissella diestrammenae]|uniref:Sugar transferase n=2 Tax=Weissella diestrammenae TaxID=1162633 RepID=A0A7G9T7H9_9LACO|nr:sugar transferase [Weissella diestrammenae]QNN76054.1 sugar transferase [Weissella diestrammenae]